MKKDKGGSFIFFFFSSPFFKIQFLSPFFLLPLFLLPEPFPPFTSPPNNKQQQTTTNNNNNPPPPQKKKKKMERIQETSTWQQLKPDNRFYRRLNIYDMEWDIDLKEYITIMAPFGGPIAVRINPKAPLPMAMEKGKPFIDIFTSSGFFFFFFFGFFLWVVGVCCGVFFFFCFCFCFLFFFFCFLVFVFCFLFFVFCCCFLFLLWPPLEALLPQKIES